MSLSDRTRGFALGAALLVAAVLAVPASAAQNAPNYGPCAQAVQTAGGAYLPPECSYLGSIKASHTYAELIADPIHRNFICREDPSNPDCRVLGGNLGGHAEHFLSELVLEFTGTDSLDGFVRTVVIPNVGVEVHTGPQKDGETHQVLETEMVRIQGSLPSDDPDFAELTIVGGSANGQPSPGRTEITLSEDGKDWIIDSTFEIGFTIHFVGAEGSALEGREGYIKGVGSMTAFGTGYPADATATPAAGR